MSVSTPPQGGIPLVSPAELEAFKLRIGPGLGIDLQAFKTQQLGRRVLALLRHFQVGSLEELAATIERQPERREAVISHLTVKVSEFFRDPQAFELLRHQVLPDLLERHAEIRVWSAGCSFGAELYSVGMLLDELDVIDRCELIGTDLDSQILARARLGLYSAADLGSLPPASLARHFAPTGSGWRFDAPAIRARTRFLPHDLFAAGLGIGFHLILCRNVLIYYQVEAQHRAYGQICAALEERGFLLLGKSERILRPERLGLVATGAHLYQQGVHVGER